MIKEIFKRAVGLLHGGNEKLEPSWMNSRQPLTREEIGKLPPIDQLCYEVAQEVFQQGHDPRKGQGKKLFQSRMSQVRSDWLRR